MLSLFILSGVFAQDQSLDRKLDAAMREGDKYINVVVVLVTIFTALLGYLVYQDFRLKKIEKDLQSKTNK